MSDEQERPIADKPTAKVHPRRIKLRHVLYVALVLVASSLAFGLWLKTLGYPHLDRSMIQPAGGIIPGVVVIIFWSLVWAMGFWSDSFFKLVSGILALGFVLLLIGEFYPAMRAGESSRISQCRHNLKQIGLALQNYHEAFGSFPPAYIADEHGKPMHSWRTRILPYLDEVNRYNEYHFGEPWDSPANQQLAVSTPEAYRCLSTFFAGPPYLMTSYLAVTGPQTVWTGEKTTTTEGKSDAPKNTVLVIELPQRAVHWMEPRDISIDEAVALLSSLDQRDENGKYLNGHLLSSDGQIKAIPHGLSAETWKALFTASADDQAPDISTFENVNYQPFNPWGIYRTIAWWSFFILALVPLLWMRTRR
ncbi:MAG: DUF1559 domain-containing protein [Planctomycetaceae bacterium]